MAQLTAKTEGDGKRLRIGPITALVQADAFRDLATPEQKRQFFKASVQRIVIELFSYCNRRCGFCPNAEGTRLRDKRVLPEPVFSRIVEDLQSVSYDKLMYWHLYNEPMSALDILLPRMSAARQALPLATFAMNTNGDYLNAETLAELQQAGLNRMYVSIYGPDHGKWDEGYISNRVAKMAEQLGLAGPMKSEPGRSHVIVGKVDAVTIRVSGLNLWDTGYDRGGLVPELSLSRSSPCLAPFTELNIDHRGYVIPCCNIYTDRPEHLEYTVGNVNGSDIFDIFSGSALQRWRRDLLKFDPDIPICTSCSRYEFSGIATAGNRAAMAGVRAAVGLD